MQRKKEFLANTGHRNNAFSTSPFCDYVDVDTSLLQLCVFRGFEFGEKLGKSADKMCKLCVIYFIVCVNFEV